jgi:hypothetical protein
MKNRNSERGSAESDTSVTNARRTHDDHKEYEHTTGSFTMITQFIKNSTSAKGSFSREG